MKKLQMLIVTIGLILCFTLTACNVSPIQSTTDPAANSTAESGIPNPASVYCKENGNKLEIQTAADGSQSGVCVFADGSTCDEWAYFRGECGVAEKKIRHLLQTLKQVVVVPEGVIAQEEMLQAVTWRQVPQKNLLTGGVSSRVLSPVHNTMTILSGRTWSSNPSTSASIHWIQKYKHRSKPYATAARSCIFTAYY